MRDWYDTAVKSAAADANVAFADWGAVQFGGAGDLMDFVHPAKPTAIAWSSSSQRRWTRPCRSAPLSQVVLSPAS